MTPKPARFPGFTALNAHTFTREGEALAEGATRPSDHPRAVMLFAWGDALPKHVAKYTDGYSVLYPHAKQIVVVTSILKAITEGVEQRTESMKDAIDAAYPPESIGAHDEDAVLTHGMSNTGCINYASSVNAYQRKHNKPMPHRLRVMDSTPGSPYMSWETLKRWANAATMGVAPHVPLPYVVTHTFIGFLFAAHRGYEKLVGIEPAPVFSERVLANSNFVPESLHSLYFYGKDDKIIAHHEIEENIAIWKEKGFDYDAVEFEGTDHVGHMRMFPDKYWAAIPAAWKKNTS